MEGVGMLFRSRVVHRCVCQVLQVVAAELGCILLYHHEHYGKPECTINCIYNMKWMLCTRIDKKSSRGVHAVLFSLFNSFTYHAIFSSSDPPQVDEGNLGLVPSALSGSYSYNAFIDADLSSSIFGSLESIIVMGGRNVA